MTFTRPSEHKKINRTLAEAVKTQAKTSSTDRSGKQSFDERRRFEAKEASIASAPQQSTKPNTEVFGPANPEQSQLSPEQSAHMSASNPNDGVLASTGRVLEAGFNPWSDNEVEADVDAKWLKTGLEWVGNNPFAAAGLIAGPIGALRSSLGVTAGSFARMTPQIGKVESLGGLVSRDLATGKFVTAGRVALNTKTSVMTLKTLKNTYKFSNKALAYGGAWAGAVFLGKWGQAESVEPLGILMGSTLIPNAEKTGDWSLVDEAMEARNELLDMSIWGKIASWSPLSPFVGIPKKIKGAIEASKIQDRVIEDLKVQLETGETDDQMYARIRAENEAYEAQRQADRDAASVLARDERRTESDEYYAKIRRDNEAYEIKRQKEKDDYWSAYWLEKDKLKKEGESNSAGSYEPPSNLGFGLL